MLGGVAMVFVIMLRNRFEWDEIDQDRWNERAICGFLLDFAQKTQELL